MGMWFWVRRFVVVTVGAFVLICAAHLVRGRGLAYSSFQAGVWSVITATVFTVSRYVQSRRGQHCAICKDTPEMQRADEKHRVSDEVACNHVRR